jgi:hypothetical protein
MGTGEITRYISKFGTELLRKAILIGTLGPYLVKAPDNPEGIDASVFSGLHAGIKVDRPATMMQFLKNFYSVGGADGWSAISLFKPTGPWQSAHRPSERWPAWTRGLRISVGNLHQFPNAWIVIGLFYPPHQGTKDVSFN